MLLVRHPRVIAMKALLASGGPYTSVHNSLKMPDFS
jgi:hypothetical protein